VAGLGLVHSLYRAHRAVVPATAWHLVQLYNRIAKLVSTPSANKPGIQFQGHSRSSLLVPAGIQNGVLS